MKRLILFLFLFFYNSPLSASSLHSINVITGKTSDKLPYYCSPHFDEEGRIIELLAPIGTDDTLLTQYRFLYYPDYTEVYDAAGHKKIYRFNSDANLTAIEQFHDEGDLYRKECFYWHRNLLLSHWVEDGQGSIDHCTVFRYDFNDQRVGQTLYGNLSGNCKAPLIMINGLPLLNGIESHYSEFLYNSNQPVETVNNPAHETTDFCGRVICKETDTENERSIEHFAYDYNSNLVCYTDCYGNETYSEYDPFSRVLTVTYPPVLDENDREYSPTCDYRYDVYDRIITVIDANGYETHMSYNARGQPLTISHPDGRSESFTYTLSGNLAHIQDPAKAIAINNKPVSNLPLLEGKVELSCNNRGQRVKKQILLNIGGGSEVRTFDALDRLENIVEKDAYGNCLVDKQFRYDGVGNKILERHIHKDGSCHETAWRYGPANRLEELIENTSADFPQKTLYRYDEKGRLILLIKPDGVSLSFGYDEKGNVCQKTSTDGSVDQNFIYDENCDLVKTEDLSNGLICLRSFKDHLLISEQLGNDLEIKNHYDERGRRTLLTLPDHSQIAYSYDEQRMRAVERISSDGIVQYTHIYDSYNEWAQLTSAFLIGGLGMMSLRYDSKKRCKGVDSLFWSATVPEEGYDEWGNLVELQTKDSAGGSIYRYAYNSHHVLENEETITLSPAVDAVRYDACGNLIQSGSKCYRYDALNRLLESIEGPVRFTHLYDAANRRLISREWCLKEKTWEKVREIRYLYDGENEIGTYDSEEKILNLRVLGDGFGAEIAAAVAIETQQGVFAPIHNLQGSVACLVAMESKQTVESYRYSAYGEHQIFDANGHRIAESAYGNPWRFQSKRHDKDGLIFFGQRYLDPCLQQWTTKDPMGMIDGVNRYLYALGNPLRYHDLYGLYSIGEFWDDVVTWTMRTGTMAAAAFRNFENTINPKGLSILNYIKPEIESIARSLFGNTFLLMLGFWIEPVSVAVYGDQEPCDKVRITAINGVLNLRKHCMEMAQAISRSHGNVRVHYIHRPTEGWALDMMNSFMVKWGHTSPSAYQLVEKWRELIQEMGGEEGGGMILHYAHSIGGTDTLMAKKLLTPSEQKMIKVITIGTASFLENEGFESVMNYVSLRDGVPYLDPVGYIRALSYPDSNVVFLRSPGWPIIDHGVLSGSYGTLLHHLGEDFIKEHLLKAG